MLKYKIINNNTRIYSRNVHIKLITNDYKGDEKIDNYES